MQVARAFQFEREELGRGARSADHPEREGIFGDDPRPGLRRLAGANLRYSFARIDNALDHHLDLSAAILPAEQARLDDLGVVENQQIAGPDELRQLRESAVVKRSWLNVQQTTRGAVGGGMLGDQLVRKVEIKIVEGEHAFKNSRLCGLSVRLESRIIRPPSVRLTRTLAEVAESVDAADSKSAVEIREGSSPSLGTKFL